MSQDIAERKERAIQALFTFLYNRGYADKVRYPGTVDPDMKDAVKPSTLVLGGNYTMRDYDDCGERNRQYEKARDAVDNVGEVHGLLARAGIKSTYRPGIACLLIDLDHPGLEEKLQELFDLSKAALASRAKAAQEETATSTVKRLRDVIPSGVDNSVLKEEMAELISTQIRVLQDLAAEMGVNNMVDANLSSRTGGAERRR